MRAVRIENNAIVARDDGSLAARGTAMFEEIPAQLVFRSIGYTGEPVGDVPFRRASRPDPQRGRTRDRHGGGVSGRRVRVRLDQAGPVRRDRNQQEGLQDTVDRILEDAVAGRLGRPVADDIEEMIAAQCPHAVTWDGWQAINAIETAAGEASTPGRPRVKLTEWAALREAASDSRRFKLAADGALAPHAIPPPLARAVAPID